LHVRRAPFGGNARGGVPASLIGPVCQAQSISVFGFVEQNVSVQFTLLYAVGPAPKVGAARIGQTERRATLMDALCGAAVTYGFIRTIVYT
jgi:hypothetical protein